METLGQMQPRMERIGSIADCDIVLMMESPDTAELFRSYVDVVTLSDYPGFSAFSRTLDPNMLSSTGFLPPHVLNAIMERFAHRAKNPSGLLSLPMADRIRPRSIDQHCSLLHLGTFDRRYAGKFIFFVPSLAYNDSEVPHEHATDYVEAGLYVAAFRRSRAIYFAGFGGTDGSFSDELLVDLVTHVQRVREAVPLPPVRIFFKYFTLAPEPRLENLRRCIADLGHGDTSMPLRAVG